MQKKWQILGLGLIAALAIGGCAPSEPVKTENTELGVNYGFRDTSYENWQTEGIEGCEVVQGDLFNTIVSYLKVSELTTDDYVTIFKLANSENDERYLVIKNLLENDDYYSMVYIIEGHVGTGDFTVAHSVKLDGQVNEAKVTLFANGDYLLLSSEAPASAYMDNYYLALTSESFSYLKRESTDVMNEYLEKKIALLEQDQIQEAIALEEVYLYPDTYEDQIRKSNNLALKKIYPLAQDLRDEEKWTEALALMESETLAYTDRAVVGADNFNAFIDLEADQPYGLTKEEVVNLLKLYQKVLEKTEQDFYLEDVKGYLNSLVSYKTIEVGSKQAEVHKVLGQPHGTLSGLYGDIYIDGQQRVIIYYEFNEEAGYPVTDIKFSDIDEK